jgi:hypothetical protein
MGTLRGFHDCRRMTKAMAITTRAAVRALGRVRFQAGSGALVDGVSDARGTSWPVEGAAALRGEAEGVEAAGVTYKRMMVAKPGGVSATTD